jgi:hypothetical protein
MHEMVGIDYLYMANWSLWTDVTILLRTIPYVVSSRGCRTNVLCRGAARAEHQAVTTAATAAAAATAGRPATAGR